MATRRKKYRTTEAIQRFWEGYVHELENMKEFLEEGQEGYIEGENTPNPNYISKAHQRLRLRFDCMVKLQSLLPFHEAEQRIEAAEQKFIELLTVIQEKAPFLLPGFMDDGQTGWVDSNKGGMARQAARGWSDGPKGWISLWTS